ncbi:hypothetical protein A8709_07375 [Paenibacillus pectinilyticus]|uniref:Glycosyl hydrolase family 95 catalytic domain-containing protein n=1 Tax=Paenibacillus pectinilyticus TaxID=512399 RepID=A0A1C0ZTT1_9BACL|nr:hypothetical protein [Paenibacillus pectinilyticus]OCT11481.1 hypothetical protein A8709_07375 [Paenibacillus pectinilyticus]
METATDRIDWKSFLECQDLHWNHKPGSWNEGAFIGNGLLGAIIYSELEDEMVWHVGRTDVTQQVNDVDAIEGNYRIPIGKLVLKTKGRITDCQMRLDLWNAEVTCTMKTTLGNIEWCSFTHSELLVTVIECRNTDGEQEATWTWVPGKAENPRVTFHSMPEGGYYPCPKRVTNPEVRWERDGDIQITAQELADGGKYATAWMETSVNEDGFKSVFLSVGRDSLHQTGKQECTEVVSSAAALGIAHLRETHRVWWHTYYPASFISLPDTELTKFYWIQMYKLASGTRADRPMLDLMGPWMDLTPWPAIWWNLNVQLTYSPIYTANRMELGESLCRTLDEQLENLIRNVPKTYQHDSAAIGRVSSYDCVSPVSDERGNLLWACHNYWLQYRYSMDEEMLRNRLYALLRRAVGYYLHLLKLGKDGRYHLPLSVSPEYHLLAEDTHYDLSLLRWGCKTLITACHRLGLNDELLPRWNEVLNNLADYPVDQTGYMIGKDVPLLTSHRHASHLMAFYPLYEVNWEQKESRELIERSLNHWIHFEGALRGYSFTIASAMYASMGRGNEALQYLKQFIREHVQPNTMYRETGPCIETPLSAATSIHQMLLQSWGNCIRVFPALPEEWGDVVIQNLRTEGAFLVSAVRKGGITQWIRVESLAGEPCRVQCDLPLSLCVEGDSLNSVSYTILQSQDGNTRIELDLPKGGSVYLFSENNHPLP